MKPRTVHQHIDYAHLRKFSTLRVWEVACLMLDSSPRAYAAGEIMVNEDGDGLDLTEESRMLTSAVQTGRIVAHPTNPPPLGKDTVISVDSLIPWLRSNGYDVVADGLTTETREATATNGWSNGGVKRKALVERNIHDWPTIDRDLKDASTNGLAAAARAGVRDWREVDARAWAMLRGKIAEPNCPAASESTKGLTTAIHRIVR